jgi:hypothetical protein
MPEIVVFTPGYRVRFLRNQFLRGLNTRRHIESETRTSDWNGKIIRLEPSDGDSGAYGQGLMLLDIFLDTVAFRGCEWKRVPAMLRAFFAEQRRLSARSTGPSLTSLYVRDKDTKRFHCGSVSELVWQRRRARRPRELRPPESPSTGSGARGPDSAAR